jgi:hypothetical protein
LSHPLDPGQQHLELVVLVLQRGDERGILGSGHGFNPEFGGLRRRTLAHDPWKEPQYSPVLGRANCATMNP